MFLQVYFLVCTFEEVAASPSLYELVLTERDLYWSVVLDLKQDRDQLCRDYMIKLGTRPLSLLPFLPREKASILCFFQSYRAVAPIRGYLLLPSLLAVPVLGIFDHYILIKKNSTHQEFIHIYLNQ